MVVSTLYLCGGPLLCIIDTCYQERAFPTRLAYIVILVSVVPLLVGHLFGTIPLSFY